MSTHSIRDHNAGDTAMTEIALALAMAFFSILVLALVSMGTPSSGTATSDQTADPQSATELVAAALTPSSPPEDSAAQAVSQDDVLVIYFDGSFMDSSLSPLSEAEFSDLVQVTEGNGRVILAVPPSLSIEEAMAIRARISRPDAIVTTLTPDWITRLSN